MISKWENECQHRFPFVSEQWFPTLGDLGVLGLQLADTPASTSGGEVEMYLGPEVY